MVEIISFDDSFYYPPQHLQKGLETLVRFPNSGVRSKSIPDNTVWVYNAEAHKYMPAFFWNDIGCGVAAFVVKPIEPKEAADRFYEHLKDKKLLRGNHFIYVCADIEPVSDNPPFLPHNVLILHTGGKGYNKRAPTTIEEALQRQESVKQFRRELGEELANLLSVPYEFMKDWTHNSIEVANIDSSEKVIYRKGTIKVMKEKVHFLIEHLGAYIMVYTVTDDGPFSMPPFCSMPYATGRRGAKGQTKVSEQEFADFRNKHWTPYIPNGIPNSSLRTEHPSCFNNTDKILDELRIENKYYHLIGKCRIWSYVGKI